MAYHRENIDFQFANMQTTLLLLIKLPIRLVMENIRMKMQNAWYAGKFFETLF